MEDNLKLNWRLATDGAGFKCETPNGLGITICPLAGVHSMEWSWSACYDEEIFEADHGICSDREDAVKLALRALKLRGIDASKLPCGGKETPA